jgi:hypothetical protein
VSADVGFFHDWIVARVPHPPPLPGRMQVAVVAAVALKRLADDSGEKQTVWAPTAFIGFEPVKGTRHVAVGLALGAGVAANIDTGVILAATVRGDVWRRWGVIAGHGIRLAPNDRLRHAWGVGVTYRVWNLATTAE